MANVTPDVVTLGEAMVVIRPVDDAPVTEAPSFLMGVAGTESNLAVGLARLGHRVSFTGRVGSDAAGVRVRRTLQGEGVNVTGLRTVPGASTGLLVRDATGSRGISVDYHRFGSAGSTLSPEDVEVGQIGSAEFLFVTGLTCALSDAANRAVRCAVEAARRNGTRVVLDPNLRSKLGDAKTWSSLLRPLLPSADILIGSASELRTATAASSDDDAVSQAFNAGVDLVVIRSGTEPIRIVTRQVSTEIQVEAVTPLDPVGAGDAFSAGLVSGLLDELPVAEAVDRAVVVARHCVLVRGDIEGLPTRDQLIANVEVAR